MTTNHRIWHTLVGLDGTVEALSVVSPTDRITFEFDSEQDVLVVGHASRDGSYVTRGVVLGPSQMRRLARWLQDKAGAGEGDIDF